MASKSKKKEEMEDQASRKEMSNEISFSSLPKVLKEEIWSHLEEKEVSRLQRVSKQWRYTIQSSKHERLRAKVEKGKKERELFQDKKHFYKGNPLTNFFTPFPACF